MIVSLLKNMQQILKKAQNSLFWGAILFIIAGVTFVKLSKRASSHTKLLNNTPVILNNVKLQQESGIVLNQHPYLISFSEQLTGNVESNNREVMIRTPEEDFLLHTDEPIPANLLWELGITLYSRDQVLHNGIQINPNLPLEEHNFTFLQYIPARKVWLAIDGNQVEFFTDQATLGAALEKESIYLGPRDWISESLLTSIDDNLVVSIRRAKTITVNIGENSITGLTAAETVGEALAEIGITPQNLDQISPAENSPVPEDGKIRLNQVGEQVLILMDETPYKNEYVEDPNTELDQISVVEPGQMGIFATRERVLLTDGEETWRDEPETWQASEAADGILGYGSQVNVRTATVDGQEIEYWRKISVYANSYSPCRIGVPGKCGYGTASGLPMGNGIIAVTRNWFNMMKFQRVFVQGYGFGTIADVGGGANYFDHYWIDLGFTDDTYQSWHHWTTMYFLTPVPAWFPTILTWP